MPGEPSPTIIKLTLREWWEFRARTHPPGPARRRLLLDLLLGLLWVGGGALAAGVAGQSFGSGPLEVLGEMLAWVLLALLLLPFLPRAWILGEFISRASVGRPRGILRVHLPGDAENFEGRATSWWHTDSLWVLRGLQYCLVPRRLFDPKEQVHYQEYLQSRFGPPIEETNPRARGCHIVADVSLNEYFEFFESLNPPGAGTRLMLQQWIPCLFGIFCVCCSGVLWAIDQPVPLSLGVGHVGLLSCLISIYTMSRPNSFSRNVRETMRRTAFSFQEEAVFVNRGWQADFPRPWSDFEAWRESRSLLLLKVRSAGVGSSYYLIPKRCLGSYADQLTALLAHKLPREGEASP